MKQTNWPSSKMRSLLPRTIARARAMICLCPTDKLLPPPETLLSNVRRACPASSCSENSPESRSASFNKPSSFWSNGSRFCRKVPISMSMGWNWYEIHKNYHLTVPAIVTVSPSGVNVGIRVAHSLGNNGNVGPWSIEIDSISRQTIVVNHSFC